MLSVQLFYLLQTGVQAKRIHKKLKDKMKEKQGKHLSKLLKI
jgi:hypothetical protein